jgi:CIC family chloride channel protein
MAKQSTLLRKFLIWRLRYISERNFILLCSILIGIIAAFAAMALKWLVHQINFLLTKQFVEIQFQNVLYLAYPLIGILLSAFVAKFIIKKKVNYSITRILHSISRKQSNINPKSSYAYLITSSLTVGFGGSVGLEAPIVATGSALGSNLGRLFHLDYKTKTLFIACGAAGAIAAIFNAPVAGVIFALEVLMLDLTMSSIIPLLISSVTGAILSRLLVGEEILLNINLTDKFIPAQFPLFILLGLLSGVVSVYFTKTSQFVEGKFSAYKGYMRKTVIGGILIGIIVFLFPPLFGDGYHIIKEILKGNPEALLNNSFIFEFKNSLWAIVGFAFFTLIFKAIAAAITTGSGGVGGAFAPALFMGGLTGFVFARLVNNFKIIALSETNFTLVGMAGVIGGVQHAPLTAIFLVSELSNGYDLFIPLMITASTAYLTAKFLHPTSIYTGRLKAAITHNKDQSIITLMDFKKLIEKDFATVNINHSLRQVVGAVSKSSRNIYPVLDDNGGFKGIISLDDIRSIMFDPELYDSKTVEELMHAADGIIDMEDDKEYVMELFKDTGAWNLPVIENGKYYGFISRSKLFSEYRRLIAMTSED